MTGHRLGSATWSELGEPMTGSPHRCLLIPLGATEQHGPHLPLDTDTRIAVAVAEAAAERLNSTPEARPEGVRGVAADLGSSTGPDLAPMTVAVAPALAYGASGEHADFPGTLSIGIDVLRTVIVELVRSASLTFERTVFVNGHGGNHRALSSALDQMVAEGHDTHGWWPVVPNGDAHAGRTETSLMLAIAPELVRLDRAEPGNSTGLHELLPRLESEGVRAVSGNGILGDPAGASGDQGRALLVRLSADLAASVRSPR